MAKDTLLSRVITLEVLAIVTIVVSLVAVPAWAEDKANLQKQEQVYGWQLMDEQERYEYQQQMRKMKTSEEREVYRNRHHERIQERAQQRGLTLPESPGLSGKGMGLGGVKKQGGGKR